MSVACDGEDRVQSGACGSTNALSRGWLVLATVNSDDFIASGYTQSLDMLDERLEQTLVPRKKSENWTSKVRRNQRRTAERTVSWSVDGCHWIADRSFGLTVVRYCFSRHAREQENVDVTRGSKDIGKSGADEAEELVVDEKRDGLKIDVTDSTQRG